MSKVRIDGSVIPEKNYGIDPPCSEGSREAGKLSLWKSADVFLPRRDPPSRKLGIVQGAPSFPDKSHRDPCPAPPWAQRCRLGHGFPKQPQENLGMVFKAGFKAGI